MTKRPTLVYGGKSAVAHRTMRATRGGYMGRTVKVAAGEVVLDIDVAGILDLLGPRALFNKSGRAIGLGGLVEARARNVTRSEEEEA